MTPNQEFAQLFHDSQMSRNDFAGMLGMQVDTLNNLMAGRSVVNPDLIPDTHDRLAKREYWIAVFTAFLKGGGDLPGWRVIRSAQDAALEMWEGEGE